MSKKHKKKRKNSVEREMIRCRDFSRYVRDSNDRRMYKIQDELDEYIHDIKKADKKYEKMKAKVKKGKCKVDLKEYRRNNPVKCRMKAADIFKDSSFLDMLHAIFTNGKTILVVICQMVATLITLILSCKKARECLSAKTINRMQSAYNWCSEVA